MSGTNGDRRLRPVLLTVDDDPGVSNAIRRDLRRHYGDRFQVVSATSGAEALERVDEIILRGQAIALFLADQRMPQMTGVEFLELAMGREPFAKRVLLTAYADTSAAIRAINEVSLDHYLLKPWDPPEEQLYPVLDDLLAAWEAEEIGRTAEGGPRVIGHRFAAASYAVRDFLSRNAVPFKWLEIERDPEAKRLLLAAGSDGADLPVVIFGDGEVLTAPTPAEVAERLHMPTELQGDYYDLVIVGGGPAGLAGAVYGASEGLRTVLVERDAPGGQAAASSRIENYLGFPVGLSGADLTRRATAQAERLGAEFLKVSEVAGLEPRGSARVLRLGDGREITAGAVIVSTGVSYNRLTVPGVEEFAGRGVYYGAARNDVVECRDEEVFVIGGANSAGQAAMYLSQTARKVTVLYRGDSLTKSMSQYLIDQIAARGNIEVRTNSTVTEARGGEGLEEITFHDSATGEDATARANSMFIFIGASPHTDWLQGVVARDDRGYILSGPDLQTVTPPWPLGRAPFLLETSLPGVFVAGDVRHQSIKRVASAVGEGAMAVSFIHQYLGTLP